jgi:hypothetical protein
MHNFYKGGGVHLILYRAVEFSFQLFMSFLLCDSSLNVDTAENGEIFIFPCIEISQIKRKLNSGNACYHSVQNHLSSRLLSKRHKNYNAQNYRQQFLRYRRKWKNQ